MTDSKIAFLASLLYVGISTIFLYSMYPSDPFSFEGIYENPLYFILLICSFPGQLFSWGIRFIGSESSQIELLLVFLIQILNVILWWRIFLYFRKRKQN